MVALDGGRDGRDGAGIQRRVLEDEVRRPGP
jgi:hypothetical protein